MNCLSIKKSLKALKLYMPSLFFVIAFGYGFADAKTIYMGPTESYTSLSSAFSAMSGGDTLIIRDGTYTGTSNQINYGLKPPSGSSGAYTTVKAENPGNVKFDGQNSRSMFYGYGTFNMSYVNFDGIQWINSNNGHDLTGKAHDNRTAHHIKLTRCGFEDNLQVNYASYVLVEDCYVWGSGRYNFIAFTADHVIFRRCVARLDAANGGGMPISNYVNYTSQYVEFQNCIAIDSDDTYYSNYEGVYGGFYVRKGNTIGSTYYSSTDTNIKGSILLNVKHSKWASSPGEALAIGIGAKNLRIENSIFWDMRNGMVIDNGLTQNYVVDRCTFGITGSGDYDDMLLGSGSYGDVSNSIFYDINGIALNDVKSSTNNYFYNNGSDKLSVSSSSGDIASINPIGSTGGLLYLPRIEQGGSINGGANVTKRIGVSGTLWGETGYTTTTSEDLWPWPHQDTIAAAFKTGTANPSSNRGFCANGMNLTKYVWEYLGNTMPSDISGTDPGTNLNPVANAGSDQTLYDSDMDGQQQVTLNGSNSYDSDGSISSYEWKEGIATIATGQSVTLDLAVGTHNIVLFVTDDEGSQGSDTVNIIINQGVVVSEPGTIRQINFQPSAASVPSGYDADSGSVYASSRGYGWSKDISAFSKERNIMSDQALDTFLFADSSEIVTWEIDLPNGDYLVSLSVGDADKPQGDHRVLIEGQTVLNESTSTNQLFINLQNRPVTIGDGRLTLQIGGGTETYEWGLTALNYIKIEPQGSSVPALVAPSGLKVVSTQ